MYFSIKYFLKINFVIISIFYQQIVGCSIGNKMADLNEAPAQDSPKHILNVLNDKCIQAIFSQLISNLHDFLNASLVCTRFQENAEIFYSDSGNEKLSISFPYWPSPHPGCLYFDRAHSFLHLFGPYIESIFLNYSRDEKYYHDENYTNDRKTIDDAFNSIADYCGDTLTELTAHVGYINLNTKYQFNALKRLSLATGFVYDLANFPELKLLEVRCSKVMRPDQFARAFPKLERVTFSAADGLNDDAFIAFQTHNPQLKEFWLHCPDPNLPITSAIGRGIADRMPNLTLFTLICNKEESSMNNLTTDIVSLGELKKLRKLRIQCKRTKFSAKILIDSFAENNVPIESLQMDGADSDFVESLPKLQQLRELNLRNIPEEMVIECVDKLHELQELDLRGEICIDGVRWILERQPKLKKFIVTVKEMTIDKDSYDKVLALAKDRCWVSITITINGSIDVSADVRRENFQWLHVMIYSS